MIDDKWRTIQCYHCDGHGMYAGWGGEIAEGYLCSQGRIFIRPTGHLFQYPSGPARGMTTKDAYLKGERVL